VAFGENTPMGGTQIKALANYRGLKALLEQMADGELRLVSVSDLHYGVNTLPTGPTIYYRTGDDMTVIVEDTRADGSDPWTLTVKLDTPFTNELESHSVDHALIFRTGSVSREISPAGVEAFSSAGEAQRLLYEINWGPAEGILASFNPGEPLPGEYKAVLQWELTCAP